MKIKKLSKPKLTVKQAVGRSEGFHLAFVFAENVVDGILLIISSGTHLPGENPVFWGTSKFIFQETPEVRTSNQRERRFAYI